MCPYCYPIGGGGAVIAFANPGLILTGSTILFAGRLHQNP